jgi:4-cresol dehydrogenase (hydroxylating) flavoprotein subunit
MRGERNEAAVPEEVNAVSARMPQQRERAAPAALNEWIRVLGEANVHCHPAALAAAETATFETNSGIPAILRPGTVSEVSELVRIASRYHCPVYPVSSGRNWGYGSRVPPASGCALIDLSRLNRIAGFDEDLGYVTVEPGVTQSDLYEFLQRKKSRLWMDATGSSPNCSLIGNAMERGFGHTPYADHFGHSAGLEVVLPSGEIIRTGHAGLKGSKTGSLYRWGAGPSLDGLFSQSNYGIVTEMTIWLMPAPDCFEGFFFQCEAEEGLGSVVEGLRPLRLNGTLRSAVHIANDYKVLAGIRQFPWEESAPLSPKRMRVLRKEMKFCRWSGSGALYGTARQVAEAKRLLREALKGSVDKLQFLDERKLELAAHFQGVYKLLSGLDLSRTLTLIRPVFNLMRGVPTSQPLASAYWRKRFPVPADPNPDRDGCGLLWVAPVAPLRGVDAEKVRSIAEPLLLQHGFEPQISITLITERTLACVISIGYDRDVQGEDGRALDCYRALQIELAEAGYYAYRLGLAGMDMFTANSSYGQFLRTIKTAVDPAEILAPGRYVPSAGPRA